MINKFLKDKRGFTLVEMIVTLAVTVVIVGVISSMVLYAGKSYYAAEDTSSRLNAVNMVTESVRELVFNASDVEIMAGVPENMDSDYTYLYSDGTAVYLNGNVLQSAEGLRVGNVYVSFGQSTNGSPTDKRLLKAQVRITDKEGQELTENTQELELFLNNCKGDIKLPDDLATLDENGMGGCLKFKISTEPTT